MTSFAAGSSVAFGVTTVLSLALLACSSVSPGRTQPLSVSAVPTAADPGVAGCALTPDASPNATIEIAGRAFGTTPTVSAGEAVAFVNRDNTARAITEGTGGHATSRRVSASGSHPAWARS